MVSLIETPGVAAITHRLGGKKTVLYKVTEIVGYTNLARTSCVKAFPRVYKQRLQGLNQVRENIYKYVYSNVHK